MNSHNDILLEAARFKVQEVHQQLPDGNSVTRQIVRHPGSVVILPILDDGRVVLIRNYRISVDRQLIELPAGTLEAGEDPRACAARELTEETGFTASNIDDMGAIFPAPGILDERMHMYVATNLTQGDPAREAGEQIENMVVAWDEAIELIRDQQIEDAKTIIGLLMYERFQSDHQK